MRRIPAACFLFAALPASLVAQCFQLQNDPAGAPVAIADDGVRTIALPFAFPFHGVSYDRVTLCANGFLWLGDPPAVDAGDFRDSTAAFLSLPPRIAVCWDDWDPDDFASIAPGGGVFFAADATQASFVWKGIPRFGNPLVKATMECVLLPDGSVHLAFDAGMGAPNSSCLTGITRGNGATAHPVDFAPVPPPFVDDSTGHQAFTLATGLEPFDLAGTVLHFAPTTPAAAGGPVRYALSTSAGTACAPSAHLPMAEASQVVGQGCPEPDAPLYEAFTAATGTHPVDLAGQSVRFVRQDVRYARTTGNGFDTNYALRGVALAAIGDDTLHAFTLARPFPFAGQAVTHVTLSSNGYLWLGNGALATQQFNATRTAFFAAPLPRVAAFWKDLVPNAATAPVFVENGPLRFLATFVDVPLFTGAGKQTFQIELDLATGDVSLHYGELSGMVADLPPICGLAPARGTDLGAIDLAAAGILPAASARLGGGGAPLGHVVPLEGARFSLDFAMRFANAPANHAGFGVCLVGDQPLATSLDSLFGAGSAPGCTLYTNVLGQFANYFAPGSSEGSLTIRVPFDPFLAGQRLRSQFGLLAPANAISLVSSNAMEWTIGW